MLLESQRTLLFALAHCFALLFSYLATQPQVCKQKTIVIVIVNCH